MDLFPLLLTARQDFHRHLLQSTLTVNKDGVASNADKDSRTSRSIAKGIAQRLRATEIRERNAGQTSGNQFEALCARFLQQTFPALSHLRPGQWDIYQASGRNRLEIARFQQYRHLVALDRAAKSDPELAAILGNDYTIAPDIIMCRWPVGDDELNRVGPLVNDWVACGSSLRQSAHPEPILHASISCKWSIRSDRAQNARSEGLTLVRNRKGPLPHVTVVTAEPMPSRIASIALGTGDVDCVYHFALPELQETVRELGLEDSEDLLNTMIQGDRLRDISDLPLDLAV